jgi:outer membrane protein OmpA-like peptidoglycan-associated protein
MSANSLPLKSSRLVLSLLACASVLVLTSCSTSSNSDRYAFWRSNSSAQEPHLSDMPHNSAGDNQARNQLDGLQQALMADHAAAISALQSQGAPTVSVLSSAQDIVPLSTNKVLEKPLPAALPAAPKPLPKPAPAPAPVAISPQTPAALPSHTTGKQPLGQPNGQSVLPQTILGLHTPQNAYHVADNTVVAKTPPMAQPPAVVATPKIYAPAMPAPIAATPTVAITPPAVAPLPTAPNIAAPVPKLPPQLPPKLPEPLPPIVADAPLPPPIVPAMAPPVTSPVAQPIMPPAAPQLTMPSVAAVAPINSSVDINLDALDNFGAPTALAPAPVAPQQPIRPETAAAAQPYAYGYSNYAIKRDLYATNQGQPIPANENVLINPIWEAAPTPGDFGYQNDGALSLNAPATGTLMGQVPFAHAATTLGPQGRQAVEKLAAIWQRSPGQLSLMRASAGPNHSLSKARANAVKQQLVQLGVPAQDVRLVDNPSLGQTRRVDVFKDSN